MNTIPKIFCLTLKETPYRKTRAEKHFKEHDLDVTFFEGINARNFGLHTLIPYMDDQPNWKPGDSPPYYVSQGQIGCVLSHYMLWKTLSYLNYDEYLILEDDVILCDNFKNKLLEHKSRLPNDWQFTFVGHCCLDTAWITEHAENIVTSNWPPMCTHAYLVKKESLSILIETNSVAWSNIDIQIQKRTLMPKKLIHYVFYPSLADQISINNPTDPNFESLMN
jgi:GR25 family glycosyltransferase involved in LPS biosynthesis